MERNGCGAERVSFQLEKPLPDGRASGGRIKTRRAQPQLFQLHMVEVRFQLNCCETDFFLVSDSQIFSGLRLITRRSGWSQRLAHPSCQVEPLGLNEEVLVRNMLDRDYQNFVSAGVSGNPHNCSFEILRETLRISVLETVSRSLGCPLQGSSESWRRSNKSAMVDSEFRSNAESNFSAILEFSFTLIQHCHCAASSAVRKCCI